MQESLQGIRIMSFNIRIDCDQGQYAWSNRVDKIAAIIKQYQPAIVCTQEGTAHMLLELLELLPEYMMIGKGRATDYSDEHCAILFLNAEVELLEEGQFWLSETPDVSGSISWNSSYLRICTWAKVNCKLLDRQLIIYNTHLDHISQQAREQGVLLIMQRIREQMCKTELPFILAGDLNSEPSNLVISYLRGKGEIEGVHVPVALQDVFESAGIEAGLTFHNYEGGEAGEPIDYIFASEDIQVLRATVCRELIAGQFPSDHYPIQCRLSIGRGSHEQSMDHRRVGHPAKIVSGIGVRRSSRI